MSLKANEIDPLFQSHGFLENAESTPKKLIYQVPLNDSGIIGDILETLKGVKDVQVDIELNSLEDAYINIAKEEEKLLQEKQRESQNPQQEEI